MFGFIRKSIGLKVSLITNAVLCAIMVTGGLVMIIHQCGRLENDMLSRGRIESSIGAAAIGKLLEEAVDNGVFTINDVFDAGYTQIPGFDPPKYHTKYDFYLDKAALDLQDSFLANEDNIFAIAVDRNGYCPTHNTVFQNPVTRDVEKDRAGNRTKRIFNDPIGSKAAKNEELGFRQVYFRDTGEELWDISSPVYVRGRHWGAFRVGVSLKKISLAKWELVRSLATVMAIILGISAFCVFLTVNWFVRPLKDLKKAAASIADGNMSEPVAVTSPDEVGMVAESIERLRVSLSMAMKRLKKAA